MEIRLIAIDLDGTLLNSAKEITPATAKALAKARSKGAQVVLASARPPRTTRPFYERLGLATPMISYNGALVLDPPTNRVLMHRPLPLASAVRITQLARRLYPGVLISAEILDRWYTDRVDPAHQTETARLCRPDQVAPIAEWLREDVTKLLLLGEPQQLQKLSQAVNRELPHEVNQVQTEHDLLQIMHATVSKAQALRVVAAELHVPREKVMAIGDNANDVGMLQWAALSAAMGTGADSAKAVADFVTAGHDDDGVAEALDRAGLL